MVLSYLLFAASLSAQPWYKDWKVWRMVGTSIASSAMATREAHDCRMRKNAGIAFCQGGYGEFAARESIRMAGSLALDGVGILGRHWGIREYTIFADGWSINNTRIAAQQAGIGCKAGTYPEYGTKYNCLPDWGNYAKPDLSGVVIVHH